MSGAAECRHGMTIWPGIPLCGLQKFRLSKTLSGYSCGDSLVVLEVSCLAQPAPEPHVGRSRDAGTMAWSMPEITADYEPGNVTLDGKK